MAEKGWGLGLLWELNLQHFCFRGSGVVNSGSLGAGFPRHHALAGSLPPPDPASPTPNWSPIVGVLPETI